jgi:hypothetical protein
MIKEYSDYIQKSMERHKGYSLEDCLSADGIPFRIFSINDRPNFQSCISVGRFNGEMVVIGEYEGKCIFAIFRSPLPLNEKKNQ